MAKEKKSKKISGSWFTINIKAYKNQTKQHYIDAFHSLLQNDPLVKISGNKHISIEGMDFIGDCKNPKMIVMTLCAYDIMDPDAFYDIRKKTQVNLDLNPDIVANKKSGTLYFVPEVHRLMVPRSNQISYKRVVKYFTDAFAMMKMGGEFDVNIEVSREVIETIEQAYMLYSLEASLSYSNNDPSSGFVKMFDQKTNEAGADKVDINLKAKGRALSVTKNGLIEAILNLVKSNGSARAKIRKSENENPVTIETKDYPDMVHLEGDQRL